MNRGSNNDEPFVVDNREQRQRRSYLTLGLILCTFALAFDGNQEGQGLRFKRKHTTEDAITPDMSQTLNSLKQVVDSLPSSHNFPNNISGIYSGEWITMATDTTDKFNLTTDGFSSNITDIKVISKHSDRPKTKELPYQHDTGKVKIQLKSAASEVEGIHVVGGIVNFIDGTTRTRHDFVSVLNGFYVVKTGKATLFVNDSKFKKKKHLGIQFNVGLVGQSEKVASEITDGKQPKLAPTLNNTDKSNTMADNSENVNQPNHEISIDDVLQQTKEIWDRDGLLKKEALQLSQMKQRVHGDRCFFRFDLQAQEILSKEGVALNIETERPVEKWHDYLNFVGKSTSDDCNMHVNIAIHGLEIDIPRALKKASRYSVIVTLASLFQIAMVIVQLAHSMNPANASKVSIYSIGMMTILDAYMCLVYLTSGVVLEKLFNAFGMAAFLKLLLFAVFEMRYMLIIWKARRPQSFNDGWVTMRRELGMLYTRFYTCLVVGIVLIWQLWSYQTVLVLTAFSFWVPQIVQNAVEDVRDPYHYGYLYGMSFSRLFVPLYIIGCPYTFLKLIIESSDAPSLFNPTASVLLVVWMVIQVVLLEIQRFFGARCFIPKRFLPKKYDYYRTIPASLKNKDCVICMVPVSGVEETSYMVTPCNHLFHAECLNQWMSIKLDCPTCRNPLPVA